MTRSADSAMSWPSSKRPSATSPNPTDVQLGAALSARRRRLNMSQQELALELGVTYQQLQKYESGKNRIAAARLWDAALILKCDVSDLFGGVGDSNLGDGPAVPALAGFLKAVYGREASDRFNALPAALQAQIVGLLAPLARALAGGAP